MNFQFTHPLWLLLLPLAWAWVLFLAWKTDVQLGPVRRWTALGLRLVVTLLVVLAIAGLQWKKPVEGVNVFFLLDRSDSIPSAQQEAARLLVNKFAAEKRKEDKVGLLVFGTEAALEATAAQKLDDKDTKVLAVVGTERTDIAGAIRLGTAAFPETGQKRLVLISDGNENLGDAMAAVLQARPLGVTVDAVPLGAERGNDVSVQKLGLPSRVKKGQTFDARIFVQADQAQTATVRLYRNEQPLGE
ncbi:MAG TPA: VWA domain-containing protein, partial [Candidatus Dormibacteraeota bacterium]|nr:VWA domain-containing protein [Candidatus Dormibacteraeota bacterium]